MERTSIPEDDWADNNSADDASADNASADDAWIDDDWAGHGRRMGDEDLNVVILRGRVVAEPEIRRFDSGAVLIRYLATVRVKKPRPRLDVIPVYLWDPPESLVQRPGSSHDRIWVLGSVQRRFWPMATNDRSRSRIEVIAQRIDVGGSTVLG